MTPHARRRAGQLSRIAFGAGLSATAAAMILGSLLEVSLSVLLGGWLLSLLAAALGWLVGMLAPPPKRRLTRASVHLPVVGLSLMMPLTLHGVYFFLELMLPWAMPAPWRETLSLREGITQLNGPFSGWVLASVFIVGLAHGALAWLAARDAERELLAADKAPIGWLAVLFWTVVASCLPGIIFAAIPPLIVALTGVVFIPPMLIASTSVCRWERAAARWDALQARFGLGVRRRHRFFPTLAGEVDGVSVTLSARRALRAARVTLTVPLSGLSGLRLQGRRRGQRGGHCFGDPIADTMLLLEAGPPEVVQGLLGDAQAYALLMEVFSGLGAAARDGAVVLSLRREALDELPQIVEKTVAVAALLEGRQSSALLRSWMTRSTTMQAARGRSGSSPSVTSTP